MRIRIVALLSLLLALGLAAVANAQDATPQVRLAAPSDCLTNAACGVGLRSHYNLRVNGVFVPLSVADAGVSALDDGLAEVAVAFTSSPEVSRPDIVALRDDRRLIGSENIVPVVRTAMLQRAGAKDSVAIRRAINGASALISTRVLRSLNQQVADGRLPEAVGGEFVDANGLGGDTARRTARTIVVGYQDFAENRTLAYLYAAALEADGFRVRVRSVRGFRAEAVRELRAGRIDMWAGYGRALTAFLRKRPVTQSSVGPLLRTELRKIGAQPLRFASGQNRNVFVMKRSVASSLGIVRISDLARYWPAARAAR